MISRLFIGCVLILGIYCSTLFAQLFNDPIKQYPLPSKVLPVKDKKITVEVKDRLLRAWELREQKWVKVFTFRVSTGVEGNLTPLGTFYVANKMHFARDQKKGVEYGDTLDFAIHEDGRIIAIHGWDWDPRLKKWGEGWDQLGKVDLTGGCVKMLRDDVSLIYNWAPLGTPILITRRGKG